MRQLAEKLTLPYSALPPPSPQGMKELTAEQREQQRQQQQPIPPEQQIFEGRVVDSEGRSGSSHVITAVGGSGAGKQTYNYATERVVGNGSFGVVFQATCLETAETVSSRRGPQRQQAAAAPAAQRSGAVPPLALLLWLVRQLHLSSVQAAYGAACRQLHQEQRGGRRPLQQRSQQGVGPLCGCCWAVLGLPWC